MALPRGGKLFPGRRSTNSTIITIKPPTDKLDAKSELASLASTESSCSDTATSTASMLCPSAPENPFSQRMTISMNRNTWKLVPSLVSRIRRDSNNPLATLRFPPHRDEMVLYDAQENMCGVVLQAKKTKPITDLFEYILYSLDPVYPDQRPTGGKTMADPSFESMPYLYLHARVRGEPEPNGCYRFVMNTETGREYVADQIVWHTFQRHAFVIKERTPQSTVSSARVTCLTDDSRELLVYPNVDPTVMLAFLAIMEEVILLTNL